MDDWKPTPTQEENDLAAMGINVMDKELDGSPEDQRNIPPVVGVQASQGSTLRS